MSEPTRRSSPARRLLREASAARGYLAAAIILGIGTTLLILAQAGLLARALATAARGAGLAALTSTVVALLIVLAGRAVTAWGGEACALRAGAIVKSRLRRRLAERALRLGPAWLTGQQAGELTTLTTRGLDALDPYFSRYLPAALLAVVVPVAVLVRVTMADWISGVIIAGTLPLIPVFGVLIGLYTKERTERQWRLLSRLGGHFLDVVEGLPTLKVLGRARAEAEVIKQVTGEHRTATMAALRITFLSALVLELAAALATALVAVEVGLRLLGGHIGYQTALLVLLLTPEAYLPLRNLGAQFHASAEGTAAAGRALEILDTPLPAPDARPDRPPARSRDASAQPIELDSVTLQYPGRAEPALVRVTMTIQPGEHVALTGPSGAGKSSLLALLLKFIEPSCGRIVVGGAPLAEMATADWRRQIAWVPQRPYLFAGTVAENIALGHPEAAPDAIARAARLAGAAEFIADLPGGYAAPLVERALNLSAGQRQRLALARAFLRDAPLLLLDEPTAHLDPATAAEITAVIDCLGAGRTVVLVSHDEQQLASADRVVTVDRGRPSPWGAETAVAAG
ncbi:MAG TPA: thiol reductant ABC exporter subunit CydD [Streptosporangiaceae bacterium]